jgi:chemotaxis protein CheD
MEKYSEQIKTDQFQSHYLYPAALFASKTPYIINTILGSCVAICLYDPITTTGGMNHFMLPLWNGKGLASPKYGDIAIERLIEKMTANGSNPKNLYAKVFGGAEVIDSTISSFNIGLRNIEMAYESLEKFKIPIKAQSVGGKLGRKLVYLTSTGEVKQKFVNRQINDNIS